MREPDGGRFTYWYDGVGQITRLLNPFSENTTFTYDAAGRRSMQKLANLVRASYSYDSADRLTTLANVKSNGTYVSRYDYAYDNTMNKTRVIEANNDRVTWSYDNTYQLTRERRSGANAYDTTYVYDQTQNRKLMIDSGARTTYTCDAANQLNWLIDGTGRTTFAYDQNGNQTLELVPALTRTTNVWDGENRLIQVKRSSTDRSTYTYKNDNLRVVTEEPSAVTSKFVWDGQLYLLETNASNVVQAIYTNEPTRYGNLLCQSRTAVTSFYHVDSPGSVTNLTNSSATVSDSYVLKAFGSNITNSGTTINPFKFIGIYGYYNNNHLIYVMQRYLSLHGRFVSPSHQRNYHLFDYIYTSNNPLDYIGHLGHSSAIPPRRKYVGCTDRERECIDKAIAIAIEFLNSKNGDIFISILRGSTCNSRQLANCMKDVLKGARIFCNSDYCRDDNRLVGKTISTCMDMKSFACLSRICPNLLFPEYFPKEGFNCAYCKNTKLPDIHLCRRLRKGDGNDGKGNIDDIGIYYCANDKIIKGLVALLLHEAAHACIGVHKTTIKTGKDACGRPDAYVVEQVYIDTW